MADELHRLETPWEASQGNALWRKITFEQQIQWNAGREFMEKEGGLCLDSMRKCDTNLGQFMTSASHKPSGHTICDSRVLDSWKLWDSNPYHELSVICQQFSPCKISLFTQCVSVYRLRNLSLKSCFLSGKMVDGLAERLTDNSTLAILDLSLNQLGNRSAKALAQVSTWANNWLVWRN